MRITATLMLVAMAGLFLLSRQFLDLHPGQFQDLAHIAEGGLQHLEQQVLDADLGALMIDTEGRGLLQHVTADGVESFHQYR